MEPRGKRKPKANPQFSILPIPVSLSHWEGAPAHEADLWDDVSVHESDLQEHAEETDFGALLREALAGLDGGDVADEVDELRDAAPGRSRQMLQKAGDVLVRGKICSYEAVGSQLGCSRQWATVSEGLQDIHRSQNKTSHSHCTFVVKKRRSSLEMRV